MELYEVLQVSAILSNVVKYLDDISSISMKMVQCTMLLSREIIDKHILYTVIGKFSNKSNYNAIIKYMDTIYNKVSRVYVRYIEESTFVFIQVKDSIDDVIELEHNIIGILEKYCKLQMQGVKTLISIHDGPYSEHDENENPATFVNYTKCINIESSMTTSIAGYSTFLDHTKYVNRMSISNNCNRYKIEPDPSPEGDGWASCLYNLSVFIGKNPNS